MFLIREAAKCSCHMFAAQVGKMRLVYNASFISHDFPTDSSPPVFAVCHLDSCTTLAGFSTHMMLSAACP